MKVIILLVVFISYKTFLFGQVEPMISTNVINNMSEAIGFYIGQSLTLQHIKNNYQDLEKLAEVLRLKFDNKFRSSFEKMDFIFSKEYSDWDKVKVELGETLENSLRLDDLSKEDALILLEEVKMRLEGDIPSPIAETILSFHPMYLSNPEQEFFNDFKKRFSSEDNQKAKGLKFQIDFPQSWSAKEGNRPNIVQKMVSQNGYGMAVLTLLVKSSPDINITTLSELQNMITIEDAKEFVPKGTQVITVDYYLIDNVPTLFREIKLKNKQGNQTLVTNAFEFDMFYGNIMLMVTLGVGHTIENEEQCKIEFELYKTLFESIAKSIVIINQWETN